MRRRLLALALVAGLLAGCAGKPPPPPPSDSGFVLPSAPPTTVSETPSPSPSATPRFAFARTPAVRVSAKDLGIDLPIIEGADCEVSPETASAYHLTGTATLGQGGNAYLYGQATAAALRGLWDAKVGDTFSVRFTDGAVATYVVTEVRDRVLPQDVRWVMPTPDERLTLQTGSSAVPGAPKVIVIAQRTK